MVKSFRRIITTFGKGYIEVAASVHVGGKARRHTKAGAPQNWDSSR